MSKTSRRSPTARGRRCLRAGPVTAAERALVAHVVHHQPGTITARQEQALEVALRRSPGAVKRMVEEAEANLAARAGGYVDVHAEATEAALASLSVARFETAMRGAQRAIEPISCDGAQILDQPKNEPTGSRIVIGVEIGCVDQAVTTVVALRGRDMEKHDAGEGNVAADEPHEP